MADRHNEAKKVDARRGIQSTEVLFEGVANDRLTQQHLRSAANDERHDREEDSEAERVAALESARSEAEEEDLRGMQQEIMRRQQEQRATSIERSAQPKAVPKFGRPLIITTFSVLTTIQLMCAIGTAVGLGIEAIRLDACEDSTIGETICGTAGVFNDVLNFFTEVDLNSYMPFEMIAYGFWVTIFGVTVAIFLSVTVLEWTNNHRNSRMFNSVNALFITTLCIAFNLTPIINIFPWIEVWGAYWMLGGSFFVLPGLSRLARKT